MKNFIRGWFWRSWANLDTTAKLLRCPESPDREPSSARKVSAKFQNLEPGAALHLLLGDLNFALVPETNASPKLFVFRTSMRNAIQQVHPAKAGHGAEAKAIANELIVKLKPGAN